MAVGKKVDEILVWSASAPLTRSVEYFCTGAGKPLMLRCCDRILV
jgi:hypothetical protein